MKGWLISVWRKKHWRPKFIRFLLFHNFQTQHPHNALTTCFHGTDLQFRSTDMYHTEGFKVRTCGLSEVQRECSSLAGSAGRTSSASVKKRVFPNPKPVFFGYFLLPETRFFWIFSTTRNPFFWIFSTTRNPFFWIFSTTRNPGFLGYFLLPETRVFWIFSTAQNPGFFNYQTQVFKKKLKLLLHSNISDSDNTEVADWRV